jgi:hypothetical protein
MNALDPEKNQIVFAEIALESMNYKIAEFAVEKLDPDKNQDLLIRIVLNDKNYYENSYENSFVRKVAIEKLVLWFNSIPITEHFKLA